MRRSILLLLVLVAFIIGCQKKTNNISTIINNQIVQIELPPLEYREYAQIIANDTRLYAEPVKDTQTVTILGKNIVVVIIDKKEIRNERNEIDVWYCVYTNTELKGWIKKEFLYIPERESEKDVNDYEDIDEYLIKSGANGTAEVNWFFYNDFTSKLSICLLETKSIIEYFGKWKLDKNIIEVSLEFNNKDGGANLQNLNALFTEINPKIRNIRSNNVDIEIDISPDLNWIWIYGINCSFYIME